MIRCGSSLFPAVAAAWLMGCGSRGGPGPADASVDAGTALSADAAVDSGQPPDAGFVDAGAAPAGPRIFYSDLQSGPSSGGQDGKGLFVTLYGKRFGSTQGSSNVTIGGGAADNYPLWTDGKIVFQLGATASTGNIYVNVSGSASSNGVPFTVRAGGVYFVATTGADTGSGSYAQPWKSLTHARDKVIAGDTVYAMDGVSQTAIDSKGAALVVSSPASSSMPIALVAYPAATVTIGDPLATPTGLLVLNTQAGSSNGSFWVFSGLTAVGGAQAVLLQGVQGVRVVASLLSCPSGNGQAGCMETIQAEQIAFLGNDVSNVSVNNPGTVSRGYHAVYFDTDSNQIEIGWNRVHDSQANCGILVSSTPAGAGSGFNQHDLRIHDNVIHDIRGDGIDFDTVDPSQGPVMAYNNIIYSVGIGPDFPEGTTDYGCVDVAGTPATNGSGGGNVEVFNNTCENAGSHGGAASGAFLRGAGSASLVLRLRNDVVYQGSAAAYLAPNASSALTAGSNNLWFGAGPAPAGFAGSINADPMFTNLAVLDFHLQLGSPAIDAGLNTGIDSDYDGVSRPQGAAFDVGAYEATK